MPSSNDGTLSMLGLTLTSPDSLWVEAAGGYEVCALAGVDFGNASPIRTELPSSLQDGGIVSIEGFENREMSFLVIVQAKTAAGLAQGEADLASVVGRPGELRWTPPAEFGETTAYIVQSSTLEWVTGTDSWDLEELGLSGDPYRTYRIKVTALPFGYSVDEIVVPAVGDGTGTGTTTTPVVTSIWAGSGSLSVWAANETATGRVLGVERPGQPTGVRNQFQAVTGTYGILTLSSLPAMGSDRWVRLEWVASGGMQSPLMGVIAAGGSRQWVPPTSQHGGFTYYLLTSGQAAGAVGLEWLFQPDVQFAVLSVARQNLMPATTTTKQLTRLVQVHGTARTPASLRLEHETLWLGQTLVYSWRGNTAGYSPVLSQYATAATVTAAVTDTAAVNGRNFVVKPGQPAVFEVPADRVPMGGYTLPLRVKVPASGGRSVSVTTATVLGGVVLDQESTSRVRVLSLTTVHTIQSATSAPVTLPVVRTLPPSRALVRITISVAAGDGDLLLDEAYLCNDALGAMTVVDCGLRRRLRIDSPTVDSPEPTIWIGNAADWSDAYHVPQTLAVAAEMHEWEPGIMNVITSCTAPNAALSARYRRAYQHNVMAVPE